MDKKVSQLIKEAEKEMAESGAKVSSYFLEHAGFETTEIVGEVLADLAKLGALGKSKAKFYSNDPQIGYLILSSKDLSKKEMARIADLGSFVEGAKDDPEDTEHHLDTAKELKLPSAD